MSENIIKQILDLKEDFIKKNQKIPTKLYLSKSAKLDFLRLTKKDIGSELVGKIYLNGVRKTLQEAGNKILGMEIIWDAEELKVE